jgi:hypothetical protein
MIATHSAEQLRRPSNASGPISIGGDSKQKPLIFSAS